jgi:hypothetical protein
MCQVGKNCNNIAQAKRKQGEEEFEIHGPGIDIWECYIDIHIYMYVYRLYNIYI